MRGKNREFWARMKPDVSIALSNVEKRNLTSGVARLYLSPIYDNVIFPRGTNG